MIRTAYKIGIAFLKALLREEAKNFSSFLPKIHVLVVPWKFSYKTVTLFCE